ncbi:sodium-dependent inorganic phosphate (Pi) transporter, partial [gut metagenome]
LTFSEQPVVILLLIKMIGAVSLLIWGTHTVKSAMLSTFGDHLRGWMAKHLQNRSYGYLSGCLTAMMLQSSTATALLVSGLQSEGVVSTAIALACVLGADLGSAVMVRVLSLDLSAVSPILMAVGIALKLCRPGTKKGDFGMILLGLGFIMTALSMILSTTAPIKSSQAVVDFFAWIADEPFYSLGGGLLLALVCFSSLAVVVIVAGLVASGVL